MSKSPDKLTEQQLAARSRRNWILFGVHVVLAIVIFMGFYMNVTRGG
ncbi:hypothetical protein [Polycyclovorans algicola]|nr:hypothetical protein [Polycyclovorans algicola]